MKKLIKFLEDDLPMMISGTALTASVVLAVVNAVCRYTISHVINGADAWITLCFAYTVYVGGAVAFKRGAHYGVDIFVARLSKRNKQIVQVILDLCILVIMALGLWLSIQLTLKAGNKTFEGLRMPYTVYDMSAVLGFGYSVVYAAEFLVTDAAKLFRKEETV